MKTKPFDGRSRCCVMDVVGILEVPSKDGQVVPTIVHPHVVPPVTRQANHGPKSFNRMICVCSCRTRWYGGTSGIWCLVKGSICSVLMLIVAQEIKAIPTWLTRGQVLVHSIWLVVSNQVSSWASNEMVWSIVPSIFHNVGLSESYRLREVVTIVCTAVSPRTLFHGSLGITEPIQEALGYISRARRDNLWWISARGVCDIPSTSMDKGRLSIAEIQDGSGSIWSATMGQFHVRSSRVVGHPFRWVVSAFNRLTV